MTSPHLSRSQYEQFLACERAGYYRYLWDGTGLDAPTPDVDLSIGLAVHSGLEALFKGAKRTEALEAIGKRWEKEMGSQRGSETYLENLALSQMLFAGWIKTAAPDFIRRFEPLKVEEEIEYPLMGEGCDGESGVAAPGCSDTQATGIPARNSSGGRVAPDPLVSREPGGESGLSPSEPSPSGSALILQTRADLIVRERESGNLFVVNWKTTQDRDLFKSYAYSSQMWTEALAASKHMNEDVAGTILIGFYKGQKRKGHYTSALLKGYGGQDIWEWVDGIPHDTLVEQFLESPPIPYDEEVVKGWLGQVVRKQEEITRVMSLAEGERETHFFQRFGKQCGWCPFLDLCMKRTRPEEMLRDGILKRRVDHHGPA